jgi:tetratricopeptide (TPR) repeat protein
MRGLRVFLLWCSCAWASSVHAQPARLPPAAAGTLAARDDAEARHTTMARALFEEGLRYVDTGRWADAQDRFARVVELRYSPVAVYNLGLAQARLGHGVVAAATLRKLLVDPSVEPKVRDPAAALLAEVEAKFGWLTLHVAQPCDACRVYVDNDEWPPAVLGVSVPIDAGKHALELRWDASLLATGSVEVAAAARVVAMLTAPPDVLEAARAGRSGAAPSLRAAERAPDAIDASRSGSRVVTNPWFWGAMGVLAAGIATTIVIGTR